ncbi:expansin [Klebsormidium nitens]|uniref:Expansin n=1 Tax=Klebsormidium nitens TaxID=105231 RepID=A0A1Y1IS55_KLENI|nr:expansin [Klebsormidium nitens]|eukprot:GAQ92091.1 expansin [Klebsormidium nitens]
MAQIVDNVAVGTTPIEYRRVPCPREGPAVVGVVGNPYWLEISVMNLAHWGSYDAMRVKDAGGVWKDLKRDWGTNFVVNEQLRGNISVQISDSESGDMVTLEDCIPEGWTTGNSFACQVNYDDGSKVATSDTGGTLPIVDNVAVGTTPIEYRRVPCPREGPAVVGVVGNPYWLEISVMNLAHWGSYDAMRVKDAGGVWKDLKRDWGTNFVVNEQLRGNISVQISDSESGDMVTLEDCIPEGWTTGNSFACRANYDDGSKNL